MSERSQIMARRGSVKHVEVFQMVGHIRRELDAENIAGFAVDTDDPSVLALAGALLDAPNGGPVLLHASRAEGESRRQRRFRDVSLVPVSGQTRNR